MEPTPRVMPVSVAEAMVQAAMRDALTPRRPKSAAAHRPGSSAAPNTPGSGSMSARAALPAEASAAVMAAAKVALANGHSVKSAVIPTALPPRGALPSSWGVGLVGRPTLAVSERSSSSASAAASTKVLLRRRPPPPPPPPASAAGATIPRPPPSSPRNYHTPQSSDNGEDILAVLAAGGALSSVAMKHTTPLLETLHKVAPSLFAYGQSKAAVGAVGALAAAPAPASPPPEQVPSHQQQNQRGAESDGGEAARVALQQRCLAAPYSAASGVVGMVAHRAPPPPPPAVTQSAPVEVSALLGETPSGGGLIPRLMPAAASPRVSVYERQSRVVGGVRASPRRGVYASELQQAEGRRRELPAYLAQA